MQVTEKPLGRELAQWLRGNYVWLAPFLERVRPYYLGTEPGSRLTLDGAEGRIDSSHDDRHLERVWTMALRLALAERRRGGTVSPVIVVVGAAGHDLDVSSKIDFERKIHDTQRSAHSCKRLIEKDPYLAQEVLGATGIDAVVEIIRRCSVSGQHGDPRTLEEACVRDADFLERLGIIGMLRTIALVDSVGYPLVSTIDPLAQSRPFDGKIGGGVDIIIQKGIEAVRAGLFTQEAKRIGEARILSMKAALSALYYELEGAAEVLQAFNALSVPDGPTAV